MTSSIVPMSLPTLDRRFGRSVPQFVMSDLQPVAPPEGRPISDHRCRSVSPLGEVLKRLKTGPPCRPATTAPLPEAAHSDRRVVPRHDGDCAVRIAVLGGVNPDDAIGLDWLLHSRGTAGDLLDLSLNGVAVETDREFAPNDRLLIRATHRRSRIPLSAVAYVLKCDQLASGRFKLVCRFPRRLPMEQVQNLVRHLSDGARV